jgi:hypothetical protein
MKNTKISLFGALLIAGGMFVAGCTDPCADVTCVNGECVEGSCVCDAGFEGTDCGTAINAKFSGSYTLSESCTPTGAATYTITVSPSSTANDQANFTGLWEEPQATVTGHIDADGLGFHIDRTALGASGFDIECTNGTISADGGTITMTYSIYATGGTTAVDVCVANLTKQ